MPEELPPISDQMQAFLEKSFQKYPGRPYVLAPHHAQLVEQQLIPRGLVIKEERIINKRNTFVYMGAPPPDAPPNLDMTIEQTPL